MGAVEGGIRWGVVGEGGEGPGYGEGPRGGAGWLGCVLLSIALQLS